MNRTEENRFARTAIVEEPTEQAGITAPSSRSVRTPFVSKQETLKPSFKENRRLFLIGGGIVLVLLLLAFNGISRRTSSPMKNASENVETQTAAQTYEGVDASVSTTPILDMGRSVDQNTNSSLVNPDQIGRTASKRTKQTAASLGDVRPFDNSRWQPAPYQPKSEPLMSSEGPADPVEAAQVRSEPDSIDKASLVFVRNNTSSLTTQKPQDAISQTDLQIGLAIGTRLRARLESAINTAVRAPVVAVIEYNYEQRGEIVVPSGSKAFGHLESADRSGYVDIRFDSLLMPDGSSVNLEAAATDLELRPLRGKVEGKHAGKGALVRSFAGVGEIAATLVGRGSLNQPLSGADLLRERVSNNIGQASDQAVANLAMTEHSVVSVPAGAEIYVILQRSAKDSFSPSSHGQGSMQTTGQPNTDELRRLLQLQRELNQTTATKPVEQF